MTETSPGRRAWIVVPCLAALILAGGGLNLYWTGKAQPSFGGFDEVNHLGRIFRHAEYLAGSGDDPLPSQPLQWPPLIHRLAARLWMATGYSHQALKIAWSAMYGLLLIAAFLLGRELAGPWAGLLTAALTGAAPPVTDYARAITLDLPLAVTVAWAMWALIKARGFRSFTGSLLFGLLAGVSCLTKAYAPAYWSAPALFALFLGGPRRDLLQKHYRNPLFNLAAAVVVGAVCVSRWYGRRLGQWLGVLTGHLDVYRQTPGRLDGAWPIHWAIYGHFGPVLILVFLLGLVLAWPYRRKVAGVWELLAGVVAAAALFALAPTTYDRFMMPTIPAVTALAALVLCRRRSAALRLMAIGILTAAALALQIALAVWPLGAAGAFRLFAHPPQAFPGAERAVEIAAAAAGGDEVLVLDEARHPYLPGEMLGYLVRLAGERARIIVVDAERQSETEIQAAMAEIPRADTVLRLTDNPSSPAPGEGWIRRDSETFRSFGAQPSHLEWWGRNNE